MKKIVTGNFDQENASHPETKGWFLGCFMTKYPEFLSDDVEMKWAKHKKGDIKPGFLAATTTKTFVILIDGKLVIRYPELHETANLSALGDFVFYDASQTSHEAEALEDSLLLVIRYPSKRKD